MAAKLSSELNPATMKPWVHELKDCPEGSTCTDQGCTQYHTVPQEIIPLNDRILLEPLKTENFSAGGIIVAGDEGSVLHAKVLAVGKGRNMPSGRIPIDVEVGDIVIYGNMANNVADKLNGKDVLLVVEQCVIAIIRG